MVAAGIANLPQHGDGRNQHSEGPAKLPDPHVTQSEAASMLNVSERSVREVGRTADVVSMMEIAENGVREEVFYVVRLGLTRLLCLR